MKPRLLHIIALSALLAAGCGRNGSRDPQNTDHGEGRIMRPAEKELQAGLEEKAIPDLISRFEEFPVRVNSPQAPDAKTIEDEPLPYYIPEGPVSRPIPVRDSRLDETGKEWKASRAIRRKPGFSMTPEFFRHGRVSDEAVAAVIVDNDLFDYTDRYYTSGVAAELYHPAIAFSPFSVFLPGLKHSINYYGVVFRQNMYTPRKLNKYSVRIGDRPFSAYITLTQTRISLSEEKRRRLETGFSVGVMGPAALGGVMQDVFHPEKPVGWVNQVQNDLVANYDFRFEQGVYCIPGFELGAFAGAQAGTLYDNVRAGVFVQAGKSNGRYKSAFLTTPGPEKPLSRRFRYFFTLELENKLVFYDATLQGGMTNRESVYTLDPGQVRRYVFTGRAGFGIGLGRYSLEVEQVYLTPEFNGGFHHFWFRVRNIVHFN